MEVEYKKHRITYREDDNEWFSEMVGKKPSLKAAKSAIDNLNRKDRQLGIPALMLKRDFRHDGMQIVEVKVGVLCEPSKGYRDSVATIKECWITEGKSRTKVGLDGLYPLSARADLVAYVQQLDAHNKEEVRLGKVLEAIDRIHIITTLSQRALEAKEEKAT